MAEELAVDNEVRGKRDNTFSKADASGEERSKLGLEEADHSCIGSKVMTKMTLNVVKIGLGNFKETYSNSSFLEMPMFKLK